MSKKYGYELDLKDLIKFNPAFGFYDDLEELVLDLEGVLNDTPKDISFGCVEEMLILNMKIHFNKRAKQLVFKLGKQESTTKDMNIVIFNENKELREQYVKLESKIAGKRNEIQVKESKFGKYKMVVSMFQWLKCWDCGKNYPG